MAGPIACTDQLMLLTIMAIAVPSIFLLLSMAELQESSAVLIEPSDAVQYQIDWNSNSNSSRSVGLIQPQIKIADESSHKIVGYIADGNGTRLRMYNNEQVVMAKYYLDEGFTSDWEIADRLYNGYFAISIPPQFIGKVESVKIFINNHQFSVNDGTSTTSQSWVFINSALTVYEEGSIIHLGPITLGLEKLFSVPIPIELDEEDSPDSLKQINKFDVNIFEKTQPRFLTSLRNINIEYQKGIPIVSYDPPIVYSSGDEWAIATCDPSSGSIFNYGANIVRCRASDSNGEIAYSYFSIEVSPKSNFDDSETIHAGIDIVPFYVGSNIVKTRYSPLVTIALLGNATLNIREVNQASLHFGPSDASPANSSSITDVNGDGFDDVIFKFNVINAGLGEGHHDNACITGMLDDGQTLFQGCDSVDIITS